MKDVILIVEDETNIRANIAEFLQAEDFETLLAKDGEEAIAIFDEKKPDLVILDLMLPKIDGLEVCKYIRRDSDVPIIMVTARDEEIDKLLGLELGADDYITKPFGTSELLARIRVALRNRGDGEERTPSNKGLYCCGKLRIDLDKHVVMLDNERIHLTKNELRIMELLSRNPGKVLTYDYLIKNIWGSDMPENNRILRVNMANIRRKLEENPAEPKYIITEIGVGYRLADETYF